MTTPDSHAATLHSSHPPAASSSQTGLQTGIQTGILAKPTDTDGLHGLSRAAADDIFAGEVTFASLGLKETVLKALHGLGYFKPTKIQAQLIPVVLEGRDVIGQAKTGTGKTAAFGLPLLQKLVPETPFAALILVPTRELCLQVTAEINELAEFTPIRACAVYGGDRINAQVEQLKKGPQIIVSTPGRLMDMVERRHLTLANVRFAILDEVDRMLDIGFRDDIRKILGKCPPPGTRQTVFVSATMTAEVERLARSHSKDAHKVAVASGALTTALVKQYYLPVQPWDKKRLLLHLLTHESPALTIVFCRMKRTVDEIAKGLSARGVDAHAIHGDMYQTKRNKVIERLQAGELKVLIASDLASRGLDVDGISHVINFDLPDDPEVYVHRIGRTARIGREGVAWSLVTPEQGELLTSIELLINAEIPKLEYPDFKPSPAPPGRGGPSAAGTPILGPDGQPIPGSGPVPPPKPVNRIEASVNLVVPPQASGGEVDASKFPGGIVPSKAPPRRMFGRVKTSGR